MKGDYWTAWPFEPVSHVSHWCKIREALHHLNRGITNHAGTVDSDGVSAIENRSNLLLSTLAKYVRALGGDVEIRAVFPEAAFNLEPLLAGGVSMHKPKVGGKRSVVAESAAPTRRRAAVAGGR